MGEEGGNGSAGTKGVSEEEVDRTDVTEVLTGVAVCGTDVGWNRTSTTVVVSEEEVGGIDRVSDWGRNGWDR